MNARVLVLGAGSGVANSLVSSLRASGPPLTIVGAHADRFVLRGAPTDRRHLLPPSSHPRFAAALRRLVAAERIDVAVPTSDADVRALAALGAAVRGRTLLPALATIDLCQDKYAFARHLAGRGVAVPETVPLARLEDVDAAFRRLARHPQLWCRRRRGQGGLGALPVKRPAQARAWIAYWQEMRGVDVSEFTLAEHLPGRDFAGQALFVRGEPIVTHAYERLSYLGSAATPAGVGLAALGRRVVDPRVSDLVTAAVRALEPRASGVFCFDAREDAAGEPRLTEINAGRFGLSAILLDRCHKVSIAATYVQAALGERVEPVADADPDEDWYIVRDYDGPPAVRRAEDFFTGIEDAP
jgi:glutathione synthase/RimK-type ligase-like ATP-grasp enzyme